MLYRTEMRIGKLVNIFMLIAIFTSCMGILGLSAFMAESRTKEIGIRKTLGSSTWSIVYLMIKEIVFLSIISNILGGFIGFKLLEGWLEDFKYRISFDAAYFLIVFGISIFITLFTVELLCHKIIQAKSCCSIEKMNSIEWK